jgi:hypothetical protein
MFGSAILDVAIGLILVYLLFSLIATAARELIELILKRRAVNLERGIRELLNNNAALAASLYAHPLVSALYGGDYATAQKKGALPSYIPARNFALALLDIVVRGANSSDASLATSDSAPIDLSSVRARIATIENPPVQRALLSAVDTAQGDLDTLQKNVEAWYDSAMDRVSGWYKRETQWILLTLGFAIAIAFNVNTIRVVRYLAHDTSARQAIVAQASAVARDSSVLKANLGQLNAAIDSLQLPIGWSGGAAASLLAEPARHRQVVAVASTNDSAVAPATGPVQNPRATDVLLALVGWLATALAISLGAPFWFDLLNKFMVVRSTVKPHQKSPEEGSTDRKESTVTTPTDGGPTGGGGGAPVLAGAAATAGPGPAFQAQEWTSGDPHEGVI